MYQLHLYLLLLATQIAGARIRLSTVFLAFLVGHVEIQGGLFRGAKGGP